MSTQTSSVRTRLEARERNILASWATLSEDSQGRVIREVEDPHRTSFQRDRDRILHAKSFRRLKRKTQVFLAPEGDHYRTRLTHTLEVAQIARSIARALFLNEDLTEAIALGHDLGHTPFGHAGESVLNEVYEHGFRHYEQSVRVVDILERRGDIKGLNLTHEVRDGILHHSTGKAILRGEPVSGPSTPEGMIVSVSDAIAYINHDIEDAVRAGIITLDDLPREALSHLGRRSSERINTMIVALIESSGPEGIRVAPPVLEAMNELRDYLYGSVYPSNAIEGEIRKARKMLRELYQYLLNHPPAEVLKADPDDSLERSTVDFVAGMTDEYALRLYQKLILPGRWK